MKKSNLKLNYCITVLCSVELLLAFYVFINHYLCMDHAEHLHAAWLVWQGNVPYRDFFEHHNPLLWYLLAPIVATFYNNALILYISRVISACIYILCFTGLWKIARNFLNISGKAVILGVIFYFIIPDNLFLFYELQPDSFMLAAFIWGLLYFFRYLEYNKQTDLSVAFSLFTISFLFLQKILLLLFGLALYILFLITKKKISLNNIFQAATYPVIILFFFYLCLYYTNSLNLYLIFNYELNFKMQQFMGEGSLLRDLWVTAMLPFAAVLVLRNFLNTQNKYRNILAGLAFAGYGGLFLTGAPYNQYFIFINLISALIAAQYVVSYFSSTRAKIFFFLLIIGGCFIWTHRLPNRLYLKYYATHHYIMQETTKQDPIINNVFYFFNIYGCNPSYYWFGYGNIAPVASFLYGYDTAFDVNKIIYEQKPKFVYVSAYPNMNIFKDNISILNYEQYLEKIWQNLPNKKEKKNFMSDWTRLYYYKLDLHWLNEHYTATPYFPLMIRKDLAHPNNQRIKTEQK